ncbi:MAG TPA: type IV pilus modification protein PilV, partial [Pseudomonadales bacterium]|nr:type IV pilus modification protein PilV [Pseudomonadales bacterium]
MKKPSVLPLHCVASGHIGFRGNGAKQRGVAILEVIIAFFVLAIGLLGLAALQVKSVQFNQGSYQRSQATVAAYDMMDRMRLNRLAASGGAYNMAWTSAGAGTGTVPKDDKTAWVARITSSL